MPDHTPAATAKPSPESKPLAGPASPSGPVGTADHPAFKPRPVLFIFSLILFASWMAVLIYWSLHLRRLTH